MNKHRIRNLFVLAVVFIVLVINNIALAASFVHLINSDGTTALYNIDTSEVHDGMALAWINHITTADFSIVADRSANLLFVVEGRFKQRIKVFDLLTLQFKKDLGIVSQDPDYERPRIFAPFNQARIIVQWWDKKKALVEGEGVVNTIFDKQTLNAVETITNPVGSDYDSIYFSSNGSKLYKVEYLPPSVNVYDAGTLSVIDTFPLPNLFGFFRKSRVKNN